ncbi:hypothetical protein [Curtobacterium sp. 179-B 9B NHS]|uniref:hypothetical protein n=1 Tax=Curtobacterium sp. 179-B 9B NHS TaxID=3374293 RepID=UPI0038797957
MHEHRRHWPWPVVLLAGALIGAAEPFGIIGEAWIADPTVDEPIVTPTDWWPPDSSFLGLLAVLGVPVGAVLGVLVAATLFALARVVDDALGVLPAALVCGVLAAGVAGFLGLPLAAVVQPPPVTMPLVLTAAGLAGFLLTAGALGTLRRPVAND